MAVLELDREYPLFDWEASNGAATAEQTRTAFWALGNKGECARFSYLVWNDMVDALRALQEALGVRWDSTYATLSGTRMGNGDSALTAARFNAFRRNIDILWRPGWPWALGERPGWLAQPPASFLGREDVYGAAQAGEDADVVYGWYLLELARKLNILIQLLRGDGVAVELAYHAAVQTLKGAASLAAGACTLDGWLCSGIREDNAMLAALGVHADHAGSSRTEEKAEVLSVGAACAVHRQGQQTAGDADTQMAGAAFGAGTAASKTECESHMVTPRIEAVIQLDAAQESGTKSRAEADWPDPVSLRSRLVLASTCEAHMAVAGGASAAAENASGTVLAAALQLDGEPEAPVWFAPVQTGSDLYIRSVWLCWHDGGRGYMDMPVFYEPKQAGSDLYIRSAGAVWTDGNAANIDTAFFLEPVREGSDLYIRQDIFGGD